MTGEEFRCRENFLVSGAWWTVALSLLPITLADPELLVYDVTRARMNPS